MTVLSPPIILTAGGTGGHLHPAAALAAHLTKYRYPVSLITDKRGQRYHDCIPQNHIHIINWESSESPLKNARLNQLWMGVSLLTGFFSVFWQCRHKLGMIRPLMIVGFGGRLSFPIMLAAKSLGLPMVIHEQNAVLGRTNRWLAPLATGIATSWESVRFLKPKYRHKTRHTGIPVRPQLTRNPPKQYQAPQAKKPFRILCIGGSQGASIFSEVLPGALASLGRQEQHRLSISQQCRQDDLKAVSQAYQQLSLTHQVREFFQDVGAQMDEAHLVIARAGASTIAELMTFCRPAILIPYPYATDDHQTANARFLQTIGGAWIIDQTEFTPPTLARLLSRLLSQPRLLKQAAGALQAQTIPDAKEKLAEMVLETAQASPPHPPHRNPHD